MNRGKLHDTRKTQVVAMLPRHLMARVDMVRVTDWMKRDGPKQSRSEIIEQALELWLLGFDNKETIGGG